MAEPREALATALNSYLTPEQVKKLIDEILAIEKRVSAEFSCKSCGQRQMHWTTVNDAKAVATSLPMLLDQSYGRVEVASVQADPIRFVRLTNMDELREVVNTHGREDRLDLQPASPAESVSN